MGNYNYPWTTLINPDDDSKQEIHIEKDNDTFTLTRKELYRLIFMLDDDKETIETCTFEKFINYLTAVRI